MARSRGAPPVQTSLSQLRPHQLCFRRLWTVGTASVRGEFNASRSRRGYRSSISDSISFSRIILTKKALSRSEGSYRTSFHTYAYLSFQNFLLPNFRAPLLFAPPFYLLYFFSRLCFSPLPLFNNRLRRVLLFFPPNGVPNRDAFRRSRSVSSTYPLPLQHR